MYKNLSTAMRFNTQVDQPATWLVKQALLQNRTYFLVLHFPGSSPPRLTFLALDYRDNVFYAPEESKNGNLEQTSLSNMK